MTVSDTILTAGQRLPEAPDCDVGATVTPALPARADMVIIGAGIIGLTIAWRAARAGLEVVVVDRGRAGAGTTMSSTGMLAASAEHEVGGDNLLPFALHSQQLWASYNDELHHDSGLDIGLDSAGTILCALSRDEVGRLRARYEYQKQADLDTIWLDGKELRQREPGLRPSATAGIFCPNDHQIDPRRMIPALRAAILRKNVTLVEGLDGISLLANGNAISGIASPVGECRADRTVVATGVWTGQPGFLLADLHLPMRPLKGQALCLRSREGRNALRHVVWTEYVHLAPKTGHRLIVGATMEEAGFDPSVTAGGVFALLEGAQRALPSLEEMEVEAVWTGFRPTTDDDAPIIGSAANDGLILAVGHHRNGILLAPATAEAVVDLVIKGDMRPEAQRLSLERFKTERINHATDS